MLFEETEELAAPDILPELKVPLLSDTYDPEKEMLEERRKFSHEAALKFLSCCSDQAVKIISSINALGMNAPQDILNNDPERFSGVLFSERYNIFLQKQSAYTIEMRELRDRLWLVTKLQYEVESLLRRSKAVPDNEDIVYELRRAIERCQEKLAEISGAQTRELALSGLTNN